MFEGDLGRGHEIQLDLELRQAGDRVSCARMDRTVSSLAEVEANWETFAQADPMWAALMDPSKAGRRWSHEDFFATGEAEIATVLGHVERCGLSVHFQGKALDFGCGVGRLTQALAARFELAIGVDISPTMVNLANQSNGRPSRCRYVLNQGATLATLPSSEFAFVYTSVVLQHMPPDLATGYLLEFSRLLGPGGILVAQIPERRQRGSTFSARFRQAADRARGALGLRTRLRRMRRAAGLGSGTADRRDATAEMHCVPEPTVRELLEAGEMRLVDVQLTNSTDLDFAGRLRYLEEPPPAGFVSKQYVAVREGEHT